MNFACAVGVAGCVRSGVWHPRFRSDASVLEICLSSCISCRQTFAHCSFAALGRAGAGLAGLARHLRLIVIKDVLTSSVS